MQTKYKAWYDQHSSNKIFEPGDRVLLLIPDDDRKLYMRWSELKRVIRQVDERNYLIDLGHRQALVHVNQIRKFDERTQYVYPVVTVVPSINEEDSYLPLTDWDETPCKPNI